MVGCASGKTVVFDGGCGLCRDSVRFLRAFDVFHRLEWIDLSDWERVATSFPSLDRERCLARIHVVRRHGVHLEGFRALRSILASLPPLWPLLPALHLPGAAFLGERVYDAVARRRHTPACEIVDGR
jgi:predicted DCC family thiol-disulfide oxidoreductase YuxK